MPAGGNVPWDFEGTMWQEFLVSCVSEGNHEGRNVPWVNDGTMQAECSLG